MDNRSVRALFRTRTRRFLGSRSRERRLLAQALASISSTGWPCVIVGGLPRSLAIPGSKLSPRDVDVVVGGVSTEDLRGAFGEMVTRDTKFGGLVLNVHGWRLDIWALEETWGFRTGIVPAPSFENLPLTTFLNIDAIAMELNPRPGRPRRIFECGFFDAILNRVVEVNLEDNPHPVSCVRRALSIASRLGFAIGPRMVHFVHQYRNDMDWESMVLPTSPLDHGTHVTNWLKAIESYRQRGRRDPLVVPPIRWIQTTLWQDAPQPTK